jgi:hypothetical protein
MKYSIIRVITIAICFIAIFVILNIIDTKNSVSQTPISEVDTEMVEPSFIEVYAKTSDGICICTKIYNELTVSTSGPVDWETAYNVLIRKAVQKVFSEYQLKDLIENSSSIVQEIRMEIGYNLEPYFADITYDIRNIDLVIPEF